MDNITHILSKIIILRILTTNRIHLTIYSKEPLLFPFYHSIKTHSHHIRVHF